jgi:UDP-N-acetyl-2-amino-2-deoxyglucuronate dehydrogenase
MSAGSRSRLVAVVDPCLERARAMRERLGFEDALGDYEDLLARPDIDVVSVCTPAASHAGIVLDAIRAKKHVLCEKPITTTAEDVAAVTHAASEQPDLCVSCVFQHRDDPALQRARWLLDAEALGEVLAVRLSARVRRTPDYYTDTRGSMETDGGGALMVQGIHLLDALIWLVGSVTSVSATMDTFMRTIDTEDTIGGWARLATGAIATIECTTRAQHDSYSLDVFGESAALRLRYRPGWARTWSLRVDSPSWKSGRKLCWRAGRRFPPESRFRAGGIATLAAGRLSGNNRIPHHLGHGPHVRRFLAAIENGGPPPVSPAEAARSLEVVLAFYRSAQRSEEVQISPRKA